jgi:membrane dipeptidase
MIRSRRTDGIDAMNQAQNARTLHEQALVWDNHACLPFGKVREFLPQIGRVRKAGVDVVSINIGDSNVTLEAQMRMAAELRSFILAHPSEFVLIAKVGDIARAKAERKLAIFFDVEGGYAMDDQLSILQLYVDLGVRWMLLVYNTKNRIGAGVHDAEDDGLTDFGRKAIAEMDRVGLVKCLSHTGYRTARDVLEATGKPTIFSHSNPRALRDHPRNIPDDLIRGCAKTGGAVCINGVGIFLGDNDIRTETLARHVDYVVQMVGADHVGLGLDYAFDQGELDAHLAANPNIWPAEWGYRPGIKFVAPEQLPELTELLLRRGYREDDVRKILGGNLLRVAEAVWP